MDGVDIFSLPLVTKNLLTSINLSANRLIILCAPQGHVWGGVVVVSVTAGQQLND